MTIENGSDSRSFHWASASRPTLPRRQLSLVPKNGSCCSSLRKRHRRSSVEPSPWRRNSENILSTISSPFDKEADDSGAHLYSFISKGTGSEITSAGEEYSPEAEVAKHVRQFLSRTLFPPVPLESSPPLLMGYSSLYERLRRPTVQATGKQEEKLTSPEPREQSPSINRISRPKLRKRNSEDECVVRNGGPKPSPGRRKTVSEPGTPASSPSLEIRKLPSPDLYDDDRNPFTYVPYSPRCYIHIYLPDEIPSKD